MTPLVLLLVPGAGRTPPPRRCWPLEVAAAVLMPWRAVRQLRELESGLRLLLDATIARRAAELADAGAVRDVPALRLIDGGLDGR